MWLHVAAMCRIIMRNRSERGAIDRLCVMSRCADVAGDVAGIAASHPEGHAPCAAAAHGGVLAGGTVYEL